MSSKNNRKSHPSPHPIHKADNLEATDAVEPINRKNEIPIVGSDNLRSNEHPGQTSNLFYTLFHSNPLPTALTRMEDGQILDVNEAYLAYFKLEREDVIQHYAIELNLPIYPSLRPGLIARLQKEVAIYDVEMHILLPSGEERIILESLQLLDVEGTNTIIQTFIDITDRVHAEQQVRSLAFQLTEAEQEERRRISQILHDDLQQRIFAVKMQISTLFEAYQNGNIQSADVNFSQLEDWLDEAIAITRNLSIDLSPAILQGDGLTDALVWLSSQMKSQYGLNIMINSNGIAARYETTLRILLFQAVREILFNIVKHADTLEANIDMEHVNGYTRISVSDEGAGFNPQAVMEHSKIAGGLVNLRQRLNLMGCSLDVKSRPTVNGTLVIIDIPREK